MTDEFNKHIEMKQFGKKLVNLMVSQVKNKDFNVLAATMKKNN